MLPVGVQGHRLLINMNSTATIENTLNSFFSEKDFSVLVLRGAWGIGKTYFWENYIQEKINKKEIEQTAYSYVSLFGLHGLSELKSRIFRVGKILKTRKEVEKELEDSSQEENQILRAVLNMRSSGQNLLRSLGQISQISKFLPQSKNFSPIIDLVEYSLINNYLICLDDIERKEDDLTIRQIMGFVDEISKRKKCKVILILNDKTLSQQDLEEFNKYREKVVDLEIEYQPTIRDNLLKVFELIYPFLEDFINVFQILNVSNIRIFKKFKWSANKVQKFIETTEPSLQKQVLIRLAVFCWGFFNSESTLSLSFISKSIKETTWLSILSDHEENKKWTEEEKEWSYIASTLGIFPSNYDDHLISMLTDGYLNEAGFREEINKANQKEKVDITQKKLREAWDIYADSFEDNIEHLKSAIQDILNADLSKISLWDFSQSIDLLEDYGDDVSDYIEKYIALNSQELASTNPEGFWSVRKIKNSILETKIQELRSSSKIFNIDDILNEIVKKQGWGREEVEFLSSLTEERIYEWMMSKPDRIVSKIRKGLFLFQGLTSNNEEEHRKYKAIADNTTAALVRIAKQNPLNRKRVKFIYKIDVPENELN
ncbi:hypothetical protein Lepto7375DRAFT_0234 [Leptolyngbya sp. PCC 7375]|nr:hypothetical protein Lepto7375DRAFT_0234 [Leptolyngbya sp. PCC 7375]